MLKPGDNAPEFKVKTHEGEWISMTDYIGKKVILWFYPKADTPGCTAEGCAFNDRLVQFKSKNTVVLGVSLDDENANKQFANKFHFSFPLLCDTEREIALAYGAVKTETDPHASRIGYLIDEAGRVAKAYPKVDAASFPETVLGEI